ncbi:MAG: hypothetical protein H7A49_12400 [Akkermansiaceae bacterium]|nr:hypothetical protein [Akkermansiaceae bacterium]
MKTMLIVAAAVAASCFALPSCATRAGSAAAGAAAYKAYDDHREEERREDYVKYKHAQDQKSRNDRNH